MKTILNVLVCAAFAASSLSAASAANAKVYVCPPCGCADDGRTFDKPGVCPSCGMALIEKNEKEQPQQVTVAVLLFDGAEIIDYAGPWEAFGEAGFKVFSVAESSKAIDAIFGQKVVPDYTFANSPAADILLVPGGSGGKAAQNPALIKWVQQNTQSAKHVMSVCTGAFILAKAGLLDGLSATTVSGAIDRLAQVAPKTRVVSDQRYVDNGKIITAAGLSSGIDGAFHLIAKVKGKGVAQATALGMEYRWDPDSKYARAALADRYFPEIDDVDAEVLSTSGDSDHWQAEALVSRPASVAAILDLFGKRVSEKTPHARGAINLITSDRSKKDGGEIVWNFTDENGRHWTGRAHVQPSNQPQKFLLTLKMESDTKAKQL